MRVVALLPTLLLLALSLVNEGSALGEDVEVGRLGTATSGNAVTISAELQKTIAELVQQEVTKTCKEPIASATTVSDPGAPARCKQVYKGTAAAGLLDCKFPQDECALRKYTKDKAKCKAAWGGKAVSCPDGIGSNGVFLTKYCAKWSSNVVAMGMMEVSAGGHIATKALVKHVHKMSQNSGVLLMKRVVCKHNKCAVFKAGLCVDVGKKVWSSIYNTKYDTTKIMRFAKEVEKLLVRYKNALPKKHLCSDTRNTAPGKWYRAASGRWYRGRRYKLRDAALGKSATLLF